MYHCIQSTTLLSHPPERVGCFLEYALCYAYMTDLHVETRGGMLVQLIGLSSSLYRISDADQLAAAHPNQYGTLCSVLVSGTQLNIPLEISREICGYA